MRNPFLALARAGMQTLTQLFPDLPAEATGLPTVTAMQCQVCCACVIGCPTHAITLAGKPDGIVVTLDRGRCIGCQACLRCCPTGTLAEDRSTRTSVRTRTGLLCSNRPGVETPITAQPIFRRSLHVREVSTGDSASDLEVIASTNAQFDVARFGIHFVASPRHADALWITGPVGRGMREAVLRCYAAMAEPRLVIAVGADAISGGLFNDGYAEANGIPADLPIAAYVPGDPPHPWSIIHGLLLAMGHK